MTETLTTPQGRKIAYNLTEGRGGPVVFLGGLKSDMEGTKAIFLEDWAKSKGRPFLRFDYSGHGLSSGTFEEGAIGDWFEDASAAIDLLEDKVILVGSSMGGWQTLLLARERPEKVAGIVTIAAAPDFTEDDLWAKFSDAQKVELAQNGFVALPSGYGEPYIFSRRMIEEGRERLVLRRPLPLPMPARFLHGTNDTDVDLGFAHRLLAHAAGPDIRLTIVKDADHRFSTPDCLALIAQSIADVSERIA
jgi:pimeloyl-ACP methyl ester carboxylesterase